jgi:hypothetical protein
VTPAPAATVGLFKGAGTLFSKVFAKKAAIGIFNTTFVAYFLIYIYIYYYE